jgi:hypothetical protein
MINFLRKLRRNDMNRKSSPSLGRYFKYAVGEIVLVVIGILIALSINNWNEVSKSSKKEQIFLTNLEQELIEDSIQLLTLRQTLSNAVDYKQVFEKHMLGIAQDEDSLRDHLINQYNIFTDFVPNSTTIDELINSNGFSLISDAKLSRQIVSLYNSYEQLALKTVTGQEKKQVIIEYVSHRVVDINNITKDEIRILLKDNFYVNQTRLNYIVTQLNAIDESYQHCQATLSAIRKEMKND